MVVMEYMQPIEILKTTKQRDNAVTVNYVSRVLMPQ